MISPAILPKDGPNELKQCHLELTRRRYVDPQWSHSSASFQRKWFDAGAAFTRFSKVTLVDYAGLNNVYDPKIVTDLTLGFQLIKQLIKCWK